MKKSEYKKELYNLRVELVKLQKHLIKNDEKLLIIFEGRDGAGKDGTIRRIRKNLSPRETKVFAVTKPSDKEAKEWYFQRFTPHLPSAGEMLFFNRSWYNRAGVEKVMGFCTKEEYKCFMEDVGNFEDLIIKSGIKFFKYYLDITKDEQIKRLKNRRESPLKNWKSSEIDKVAVEKWDEYTLARDEMFAKTHTIFAPWSIVLANDKKSARLSVIKDLLSKLNYKNKDEKVTLPNPKVVFSYDEKYIKKGVVAN